MKKLMLLVCLLVGLVGCSVPAPVKMVSDRSIGKVVSIYCYHGDFEIKTDTGFDAPVKTDYLQCPVIQIGTEARLTTYSNDDCWIYLESTNTSYRCHL